MKGLPSNGSDRGRAFVWPEVREWYVQYRMQMEMGDGNDGNGDEDFGTDASDSGPKKPEDIRAANLRKTKAEADLKELQLSEKRGEVIVIVDAKTKLDRMMGNLRAKILGVSVRLVNRIEGEKDRAGREVAIKEEMETLCREISTGAVVELPTAVGSEVIEEISAAAEVLPTFAPKDYGL